MRQKIFEKYFKKVLTTRKRYAKISFVHTERTNKKSTLKSKQQNPLEKKPNGDFLEIEKYQKVNQKKI